MSENVDRRQFLGRMWAAGAALVGLAGGWTTWDLLKPLPTTGFGGKVRAILASSVSEDVTEIGAAKAYLTEVNGAIVAISHKCTHLGCRVPYCESSGQFECPCHGSVFSRAGDFISGPSPRGMDRYEIEVDEAGMIHIDTGATIKGGAPGTFELDEPARGPACDAEGGH